MARRRGRTADLSGFDWPDLQCDRQRLGRVGRPLSEEQADAVCRHMARQ